MSIPVRHSGRIAFAALIVIALIAALLGVRLFALAPAPPATIDTTTQPSFTIGPIEGLTTTWHWAPPATSIPVGTLATFFQPAPRDTMVIWTGADEVARDDQGSTAVCWLVLPGITTVQVQVIPADGGEALSSRSLLNVVDVPIEQITVSAIDVWVDPVEINEDLPQDEINEQTMGYFFGLDSIAALRDLGDGFYRTSVNRRVHARVEVNPPGFAPLIEWRFDGQPAEAPPVIFGLIMQWSSEGMGTTGAKSFPLIGHHVIEIGPPLNPAVIEVETYGVTITSPTSGDEVPEGEPVLFIAETDPPGYEDEITWLSSTKYGTAEPILGEGPLFVAEFDDTWGTDEDGVPFQWVGVIADNARFNQDEKCDDCPDPPATTRITFATDTDPAPMVCNIIIGGGLQVCMIPGGAGLLISITDQGVVKCEDGGCGDSDCRDGCARRWEIILNPQGVQMGDNWRVGVNTPNDVCDCEWPNGTGILQGCDSALWLGEWSWNFLNPQGTIDYLCK